MDQLHELKEQTRVILFFAILVENILLIAVWAGTYYLELDWMFTAGGLAAVAVVGATSLMLTLSSKVMQPITLLWQAILHLSPSDHGVAAPDLTHVRYGRELVANLSAQVYQLASVAEQVHSAQAAEQSSLKSNFIANNLPLPMIVLDQQETILFINPAAVKYLQLTEDDAVGKSVYSLLDMSFPNEHTFDVWLKDSKQNSVTATNSWERVRLGLQSGSLQFDLAAYYNKDNAQSYETVLVLFDHTEQYSQDDQAVSFVALAVHELRTPLTLLRGYIEAFQDEFAGKLTPELDGFMHKMEASAEQLAAFVNNILNVARIEDDQLVLQLHEENWTEVLQGAVSNYQLRAQVRGITLECAVSPDLPTVAIDRVSIYEVLGNLIDNAIKYSGDSKRIVITSTLSQEGFVQTTVQDFGVGVPTSVVPNLFTKFYRNHRNRAQIGGTGLGLYLAKIMIQAHDGNIWVRSEEGKGSTFGFTVMPFSQLVERGKTSDNSDIVRGAHGWIKNHSLYRR